MHVSGLDLPPDLKAFIFACIDTVEQVEMLALLHGSREPLSAEVVSTRVGVPTPAARHHLEVLSARGLLHVEVGAEARYRYHPKSDELRRYADQLIHAYAASRMLVLRLVAQNAKSSLKSFVAAFRLRGED
jgi:predicted ArsR family transcriptional regulator